MRSILFDSALNDMRNSTGLNSAINDMLNNGGYRLWFGNGQGAFVKDGLSGYSYKILLYNYGLLGCALLAGVFISIVKYYKVNRYMLPFLAVFFVSIYQRPIVYTIQYLAVFICTISLFSKYNTFEAPCSIVNEAML